MVKEVEFTVTTALLPAHVVAADAVKLLTAGKGFTVTVALFVNCAEQLVAVIVASTLKVVVEVRLPVGKLIVLPVPPTAEPTRLLSASFLNW